MKELEKLLPGKKGILFVYDALRIGGCERVITVLAKSFASKGIPVTILMIKKDIIEFDVPENVTVKTFKDYPQKILKSVEGLSIYLKLQWSKLANKVLALHKPWQDKYKDTLEARAGMWRIYSRYCGFMKACFDDYKEYIVISFMDNPNFATLLTSKHCSNTVIVSERSHPDRDDIQIYFRKYRNKLYSRADLCVFQLDGARSYFPARVQSKSVVIENPITQVLPEPHKGPRRKEIITFCRLDDVQKNLTGLINAFEKIHERFPEYNLAIYGKGAHQDYLQEHINSLKLSNRVELRPYDSKVHDIVKDAAMFVSFANYEGLSNSMLEAMAIGMPVICSDCPPGGARLMITHGENGLLVPVGDEEKLSEAMVYMLTHPEEAEAMGIKAANIRNRCDPEAISKKWLQAIKSMLTKVDNI